MPTKDGAATLNGQIDWPAGQYEVEEEAGLPLVFMVPGTGLFDRDVYFGNSNTDADLIFKTLGNALTQHALAVLRFDKRGVSCNERTVRGDGGFDGFIEKCVDREIRSRVTPATIQDDIKQIFDNAASHDRIDPNRIILFTHSEGTTHVARLVKAGQISARGLVALGFVAESPKRLLRWQLTKRMADLVMLRDSDGDGSISNDEIKAGGLFLGAINPDIYLSASGLRTEAELRTFLGDEYETFYQNTLAIPDDRPYGRLASYAWWKMYVVDDRPVVDDLFDFDGVMAFHNGANDSQTPASRNFDIVRAVIDRFKVKPKTDHAHAQRPHPRRRSDSRADGSCVDATTGGRDRGDGKRLGRG